MWKWDEMDKYLEGAMDDLLQFGIETGYILANKGSLYFAGGRHGWRV